MNQNIANHLRQQAAIFGLLGTAGGFVSDVLQPLAPFSKYIFVSSAAAAIILALAVLAVRRVRHRTVPLFILSLASLIVSGVMLGLQTKETEAKGVLASNIPALESLQTVLGLIQKDVAEIKET